MKVKLTMELDIPDVYSNDGKNHEGCYVPGISWPMAFVQQTVFDNFVNHAICSHNRDACRYMIKIQENAMPESKEVFQYIVDRHSEWADIIRNAESTLKLEEIK